jgi:hypothetical protein
LQNFQERSDDHEEDCAGVFPFLPGAKTGNVRKYEELAADPDLGNKMGGS